MHRDEISKPGRTRLSDREAEANLAIEGLHLSDDERAFLDALDREELDPEERLRRIRAYALTGRRPSAAAE